MPIDKRIFTSGMDSDSDDRLIGQGFYRTAKNVRVGSSDGEDVGALENVRGNTLVGTHYGDGKVIGSHRSEERNSIIYFVYDQANNHGIYEYKDDSLSIVLVNSILNFSEDHLITGINDIDGLLYWTDDYNPPRKINIEKAKAHTQSNGSSPDGYSSLLSNGTLFEREQFISAIKAQPAQRPTWQFVTDTSKDYNRVRHGKYFKFKYRYVYDDNEKSAWSSVSDITYTDYDVLESTGIEFSSFSIENMSAYNAIVVSFLSGHETVKRIEVAASESESDFFLIADVDNTSSNTQSITFYNDATYTFLDVNESIKPFDDVPRLAKAQELIDGNKIVYGNYVTGYDHHEAKSSFSVDYFEPGFFLNEDQTNFGPTVFLNDDTEVFESSTEDGLPGNDVGYYGKRRATGIALNANNFEQHLVSLGYDLQPGYIVEIAYSLGLTEEPYSLAPYNPYGDVSGPNTTSLPLSPSSIVIAIPSNVDNAYENLYQQLSDYQMSGTSGTLGFMSRGGFWRRYNPSDYREVLTVDEASSRLDDEIDGISFFERVFFRTYYNPTILLGDNSDTGLLPGIDWYFEGVPGSSRANNPLIPVQPLIGNGNNGKTHGKVGVYSFKMRIHQSTMENLADQFGFPNSNFFSSFKAGSYHTFGIVYHDEYGRFGFVNRPNKVYVPHLNDRGATTDTDKLGAKIRWNISGYAPPWAKYYSWFYSGNSRGYNFIQFIISGIEETNVQSVEQSVVRITLKLLSEYQSQNDNLLLSYDFSEGDRIRFIRKPNGDYFTSNLDLTIISAQDGTNGEYILTIQRSEVADSLAEYDGAFVEIYKQADEKTEEQQIFKEISPKYSITQTSLLNGQQVGIHDEPEGTFLRGDVFLTKREIFGSIDPTTIYCETPNISDFYRSNFRDGGKANAFDRDQGEERYISQVTYSLPYVSGSKINGLSDFNPVTQPYKDYDRRFGSIQKLYSQDNALIIFQEDKVNRSMVSRNVIFDNQGNATLVGTVSNTLSDAVAYQGEHGISKHPESFAQYGGRIYFVDAKRGAVMRLSRDGITPISQYKMSDYFMDELTDNIDKKIYGGFDPRFGEYILAIEGKDAIGFSEGMNIWTSFYGFSPETMVYLYKNLYTFKYGNMYKHNSNDLYNVFYQVAGESSIEFVTNAAPSDKKVFNAIGLEGNAAWAMEDASTPSGQSTSLLVSDFDEREGFYYSDLLFDVNTPNVDNPLIEGDRMRDYSMTIKLTNNLRTFVELFAVNVNFSKSFRHNG